MDANLVMPFAGAMDYPLRTRKNGTRLPSTPSSNNNTGSLSHSATIKNSLLARGLEMTILSFLPWMISNSAGRN
ncbi:hypothetical protein AFLA_002909 [Aspergillus flavus NRRL3357]|nr:hypothetical protein AFLA_002909 [Aspergillus flavus NRRL3357]